MEELDLEDRVRTDTTEEPINHGHDVFFDKPQYLFSINRLYLSGLDWGFRFFLDGLFLDDRNYTIKEGMDFYYIYIPQELITETSVLEIERYKKFEYSVEKVFLSSMDAYELILDKDMGSIICVNDVYIVDIDNGVYVDKEDYTISIETTFINSKKEIVTGYRNVDTSSFMHLGVKSYVRLKKMSYIGKRLMIGIHRNLDMVISKEYQGDNLTTNSYAAMRVKNEGN